MSTFGGVSRNVEQSSQNATLRVATLNLRHNADDWKKRAPMIVEELHRDRAHLIALQEVWLPIEQGAWLANELNLLAPDGEEAPYVWVQRPKWGIEGGIESVGVLSRLPVLEADGVDLPGGRVASSVLVKWRGTPIHFVSLHLHYGPPDASDGIRRSQIRGMHAWLTRRDEARPFDEPRPLTIIAGDLNATPEMNATLLMREQWRSVFERLHGEEPDWTFGTPLADRWSRAQGFETRRSTLDYIFVSPELEPASARLFCTEPSREDPTLYPSDHLGLYAELVVPPIAANPRAPQQFIKRAEQAVFADG